MDNIADMIKSTLSMYEVARAYGFELNRAGNIICPFHQEKTASLKIYKEPGRGFHCYGCGVGGSVIDFVMRLFNIPFSAALVRLNADFHLGLTNGRPDPHELDKLRQERREREKARTAYEADYDAKTYEYRRLWAARLTKAPASPEEDIDPEYAEALRKLDTLDEWFLEHPFEQR